VGVADESEEDWRVGQALKCKELQGTSDSFPQAGTLSNRKAYLCLTESFNEIALKSPLTVD
jgi:hypothetical protein